MVVVGAAAAAAAAAARTLAWMSREDGAGSPGEPEDEMFWVLNKQMQGTRTAAAMADAQFDKLVMDVGKFTRCLGASRASTLRHDVVGEVWLAMTSDDGLGAAVCEAGITYTTEVIQTVYGILCV